jgi:hypothetical protein
VSPGVEALKSAGGDADAAARSGQARQLVLARVATQDARNAIASELVDPEP